MTTPLAITSRQTMLRDLTESSLRYLSRPLTPAVTAKPVGPAFDVLEAALSLRFDALAAALGLESAPAAQDVFATPSLVPLPPVQEAAMEAFTDAHDALRLPATHRRPRRLRLRHGPA